MTEAKLEQMMKLMEKLQTQNDQLVASVAMMNDKFAELNKSKEEKNKKENKEEQDKSFFGVYGEFFKDGQRIKHTAELKDGSEDDWFGSWDAKHKVFKVDGSDQVCDSLQTFGDAHYAALGDQNEKKAGKDGKVRDGNGGWDKVKVYDDEKKRFITAKLVLPDKPRAVSRAKSASRRGKDEKNTAGKLSIANPKKSNRKPEPSPKVVAQAAAIVIAAAAAPDSKKQEVYSEAELKRMLINSNECYNCSEKKNIGKKFCEKCLTLSKCANCDEDKNNKSAFCERCDSYYYLFQCCVFKEVCRASNGRSDNQSMGGCGKCDMLFCELCVAEGESDICSNCA